jgi:hypothetical protein
MRAIHGEDLWAMTTEQRLAKAAGWLASYKSDAQTEFMQVAHPYDAQARAPDRVATYQCLWPPII